ncbi:MAG: hypothetical protein IKQ49_09555 [Eubacterium sp.]|nr:hypothetical protein [Eubacterium sp.]
MTEQRKRIADDMARVPMTAPGYLEYEAPGYNLTEMLRYSGFPAEKAIGIAKGHIQDETAIAMTEKVRSLAEKELRFRVEYLMVPLSFDADGFPVLPFPQHSESLKSNLSGCHTVLLFAATVGAGIDRLIRRYERTDANTALYLQGCGAERAESLCDTFEKDVASAAQSCGMWTRPRFSPGYGNLPLSVQKDFLILLNAEKRLGITLGASYLMSPSKSVTAIIGIGKDE